MGRTYSFGKRLFRWPRMAQRRRQQAEDMRDLGKIALVFAVIAVGYFEFAPEERENANQPVSIARN